MAIQLFVGIPGIPIVLHVGISYAKLQLKIPVVAQGKGIAIAHTSTQQPTVEAIVAQSTEVGTQELDVVVDVTNVVAAIVGMNANEVPRIAAAKPVASLRLREKVLPLSAIVHLPVAKVAWHVERPVWGKSHFNTEVDRTRSVIKQVSLKRKILRIGTLYSTCQKHNNGT